MELKMKKILLALTFIPMISINSFAAEADIKSGDCMGTIAVLIRYSDNEKIGSALKSYWGQNQPYMKSVVDKVGKCVAGRPEGSIHEECANKLPPKELDFYKGWNRGTDRGIKANFSEPYLRTAGFAYCGDVAK
jgi:hypothetical protein